MKEYKPPTSNLQSRILMEIIMLWVNSNPGYSHLLKSNGDSTCNSYRAEGLICLIPNGSPKSARKRQILSRLLEAWHVLSRFSSLTNTWDQSAWKEERFVISSWLQWYQAILPLDFNNVFGPLGRWFIEAGARDRAWWCQRRGGGNRKGWGARISSFTHPQWPGCLPLSSKSSTTSPWAGSQAFI